MVDFSLPFSSLTAAHVATLRAAHVSAKGQLTSNLSLTFGGIVYNNLCFVDDVFAATEYSTLVYRSEYKLRQTIPQALASNANGNVYPTILAQLPYTREHRFSTYVADQESGPHYAYGLFGTGNTNFPGAAGLSAWTIQYDMLSDADLALLEPFFVAMAGRYGQFQYTDPDSGTLYQRCGFDQDTLQIQYSDPGMCAVTVRICEQYP
ncbi:MAG: hypothetical protein NVS9B4_01050 [Candidatus Acidiferrum sp.]